MYLRLPFGFGDDLQNLALVLNTVLLIGLLVAVELRFAEAPQAKRQQLLFLLPLVIILVGILFVAVSTQMGSA